MNSILNDIQKIIDERKAKSKELLGKGTAYDDYMDYVEDKTGVPYMTMIDELQSCVNACRESNTLYNRTRLVNAMSIVEPYIRGELKPLMKKIKVLKLNGGLKE